MVGIGFKQACKVVTFIYGDRGIYLKEKTLCINPVLIPSISLKEEQDFCLHLKAFILIAEIC